MSNGNFIVKNLIRLDDNNFPTKSIVIEANNKVHAYKILSSNTAQVFFIFSLTFGL